MTKRQKEIFIMYLNSTRDRMEEDIRTLRQQLRYRNVDVVDCLELQLALERFNVFQEFSRDAKAILQLDTDDKMEGNNKNGL